MDKIVQTSALSLWLSDTCERSQGRGRTQGQAWHGRGGEARLSPDRAQALCKGRSQSPAGERGGALQPAGAGSAEGGQAHSPPARDSVTLGGLRPGTCALLTGTAEERRDTTGHRESTEGAASPVDTRAEQLPVPGRCRVAGTPELPPGTLGMVGRGRRERAGCGPGVGLQERGHEPEQGERPRQRDLTSTRSGGRL